MSDYLILDEGPTSSRCLRSSKREFAMEKVKPSSTPNSPSEAPRSALNHTQSDRIAFVT
jgi:hypothetical protein